MARRRSSRNVSVSSECIRTPKGGSAPFGSSLNAVQAATSFAKAGRNSTAGPADRPDAQSGGAAGVGIFIFPRKNEQCSAQINVTFNKLIVQTKQFIAIAADDSVHPIKLLHNTIVQHAPGVPLRNRLHRESGSSCQNRRITPNGTATRKKLISKNLR